MHMDDMENKTKLQSLMDLVSKMHELQTQDLRGEPKGLALEMHESHVEPLSQDDIEKLEESTHTDLDNDNEEGESPEHKELVMGENPEECEDEDEESPSKLSPEMMKLLMEHLANK